jgi:hypothetical protein
MMNYTTGFYDHLQRNDDIYDICLCNSLLTFGYGVDMPYPGTDVVAILTGHDEYFSLDTGVLKGLMGQERPVVVDGRNVVDADGFIGAGFVYKGIGRGDRNEHLINYHS